MTYPCKATYTPVPGKLAYHVLVYASRQMFGRQEYQIQYAQHPAPIWITTGQDGQQLQFEEDLP